jgi:glycerol kinase
MLLDIATGSWDDELLELFGVDRAMLPDVVPSSGHAAEAELLGSTVPISGIAGDQQAALFGQGCFAPGEVKATYGTGTFVLANLGGDAGPPSPGLLKTAAATAPDAPRQFAAEGAILVGGAAVQWLRDGLGVIADAAETERLAREVDSTGGVTFVPALTGLGSPHWDPDARGLISGITRGTTRAHLARAALEAIAHQVADVLEVLPIGTAVLRADGGATANAFLMQLQADLIGSPVEVAADADATALGAAALAGLAVGTWQDTTAVASLLERGERYEPSLGVGEVAGLRDSWRDGLARTSLRP